MGNSSSSSGRGHHDDTVDYGNLVPQGVYTGPQDWNQSIVSQLICARKLAPFYRPLEDYDESWDDDLADPDVAQDQPTRIEAPASVKSSTSSKRPALQKDVLPKAEAALYRGAVECPICFLYYPPNINHSRCCDHPICTECFVQIKRSEPTTTHLVSDPAACPYCVQEHFGVVYKPPPWRAGIGTDGSSPFWADSAKGSQQSIDNSSYPTHKRRQKSYGADSPEVVTIDQIRPDWEAKLAAVRAAVTRRANRRIIMRQVGDRLIPVGVTSGRVHALTPEEAAQGEVQDNGGSRRSRRRQQNAPTQGLEQYIGMGGQDLEELMVMEAMRLSLLEHEEQQRKEAEEKKKKASETASQEGSSLTQEEQTPIPNGAGPSSTAAVSASNARPTPMSRLSTSSSQSKRRSFLSSRSRSPSPPSGEPSSSWRKRLSNPNPASYGTLNAALSSTTSTASAFVQHLAADEPMSETIPTISVDAASPVAGSTSRPIPVHQDSAASQTSVNSTESNAAEVYDNLPSSPESVLAHEPLLGSSDDDSHTPTKVPAGSRDYFGETSNAA
ncbi:hypothetical protein BDZ89DRAFT_1098701 [Hymenopellis radicata]|nr:hypothetical protein BDZ89DRAFT_1098701 [Hymenopellis radicata]